MSAKKVKVKKAGASPATLKKIHAVRVKRIEPQPLPVGGWAKLITHFGPKATLGAVRKVLKSAPFDGSGRCVLCRELPSKPTVRILYGSMVETLVLIYRYTNEMEPPEGWVHVSNVLARTYGLAATNREYTKFKHWGFLQAHAPVSSDGLWRITEDGRQFVCGQLKTTRALTILHDTVIAVSADLTDIWQALGEKFDYDELMGWKK